MQVLLDARHLLFSLASPASTLMPAQSAEAIRRARDKVLQERAADISLDFWRAARPAADVANNDDKLNAAKMRAVVSPPFNWRRWLRYGFAAQASRTASIVIMAFPQIGVLYITLLDSDTRLVRDEALR